MGALRTCTSCRLLSPRARQAASIARASAEGAASRRVVVGLVAVAALLHRTQLGSCIIKRRLCNGLLACCRSTRGRAERRGAPLPRAIVPRNPAARLPWVPLNIAQAGSWSPVQHR